MLSHFAAWLSRGGSNLLGTLSYVSNNQTWSSNIWHVFLLNLRIVLVCLLFVARESIRKGVLPYIPDYWSSTLLHGTFFIILYQRGGAGVYYLIAYPSSLSSLGLWGGCS